MTLRHARLRRAAMGLAALGAMVTALVVPVAPATAAQEVYAYPSGYATSVELAGHGSGHGRGLSQWGAYGAANSGLAWPAILDFYYPGTTRTALGNPTVRIRLDQLGTTTTYLAPAPGLTVEMGRPTAASQVLPTVAPTGAAVSAYRSLRAGSTLKVQLFYTNAWHEWDVTGNGSVPSTPFVFSRADGGALTSQLNGSSTARAYRGVLVSYPSATSSVMTVNELPMDSYLRGVVPSEMPASWHSSALAAQSVAARTYAAGERAGAGGRVYDLCDTTSCQVYKGMSDDGTSNEQARTDQAIIATGGVILAYEGAPAFTQFSASNGGYSVAGSQPYLVAKADPYDGAVASSVHSWAKSLPISTIASAYPQIGTLTAIRILSRDGNGEWGGRVLSLAIDGTAGSVPLTGTEFASRFGLLHYWFKPTNSAPPSRLAWPRDFSGDFKADVLGVTPAGLLRLHRGNGAGGWSGAATDVGSGLAAGTRVLTAGPWDAGSTADLLAIRPDGSLWLYPGTGGGGWGTPTSIGVGFGGYNVLVGVGDLTGDRINDLVARHPDSSLYVFPGNGAGGFQPRRLVSKGWGGFTALFSPADFNGDGRIDLITRDSHGVLYFYPGTGNGTFAARSSLGPGWTGYLSLSSAGDFNGDRSGDVLARAADGTLYLWASAGNARFRGRTSLGGGWQVYAYLVP